MGESRPPLRAAFWAISAALLLMLLATLSDPYRVRQSMLARRTPVGPSSDVATPHSDKDGPLPADDRVRSDPLTPSEDAGTSPDSALIAREAAVPTPTSDHPAERDRFTGGAETHVVSNAKGGGRRQVSRPTERSAMPILAPGELTGAPKAGRFEELPPPPELAPERDSIDDPLMAADAERDRETERALERLQLETELLTLRHDLTHSIESRQIEQIQHLQQQQNTLLERQQQTAERLEQLTDQLASHSARLERLYEAQARDVPSQATGRMVPGQPAHEPVDESDRERRFEQTGGGRHRLSLVIESDDVAGILERLGRWSAATALEQTSPPVSRSTFAEPQPRYLAPPPTHSDPAPLSDLEHSHQSVSPGPTTGGPLFAAPAICR